MFVRVLPLEPSSQASTFLCIFIFCSSQQLATENKKMRGEKKRNHIFVFSSEFSSVRRDAAESSLNKKYKGEKKRKKRSWVVARRNFQDFSLSLSQVSNSLELKKKKREARARAADNAVTCAAIRCGLDFSLYSSLCMYASSSLYIPVVVWGHIYSSDSLRLRLLSICMSILHIVYACPYYMHVHTTYSGMWGHIL